MCETEGAGIQQETATELYRNHYFHQNNWQEERQVMQEHYKKTNEGYIDAY